MGIRARLSPSAEAGRCRTPTLRVDTPPPQEGPTCTRTPHSSLPPTIPGGRTTKGSRGSTAQRSLRKPLPLALSWIWSCEDQNNSEATRQDGKLHAANLSTWRVPRSSGNCRKTAQIPKLRGSRRSPGRTRQPEPGATEAPASRRTSSTNAGTRNGNQPRTNTKLSTSDDERGQTLSGPKTSALHNSAPSPGGDEKDRLHKNKEEEIGNDREQEHAPTK